MAPRRRRALANVLLVALALAVMPFVMRAQPAAQGFMTALPAMVVTMNGVDFQGDRAVYRWTLTGTNTGPGGSGNVVRISGCEEWWFGADGLIPESKGHFDEADYTRRLSGDASGR